MSSTPVAHERRVIRRLEARGEPGLGEALVLLDGVLVGSRYRIVSLYAVGSEGAVFLARDERDRSAPMRVAKVAVLPLHRPFDLTDDEIARRRAGLREEAENLDRAASPFMPKSLGLFHFPNPALEASCGGEFAEPEPCLVMEKLPGFDLDLWLARVHSSKVPKQILRRHLDHVAVVVLSGLMDLQDKGYYYADLRPGNVRIRGRSRERVRLMDAGSLVRVDDHSGKFPHVPAYLPPEMFPASRAGARLVPSPAVEAVMAGRTLFEVATGRVPRPGQVVDLDALRTDNVSPPVAETIERLCCGSFPDVATALAHLSERIRREAAARGAATIGRAPAVRPALEPTSSPVPAAAVVARPVAVSPPSGRDLHSVLAKSRMAEASSAVSVLDAPPVAARQPRAAQSLSAAVVSASARGQTAARAASRASEPGGNVLPPPSRKGFLARWLDRILRRG